MATYYMRADGTGTKAEATGPASSAAACMSVATHNANTFSAGDIIYLSDQGGTYTAKLVIPSSGSSGNPITYQNAPGESPLIDVGDAVDFCLTGAASLAYVTISGIDVANATTRNIWFDGAGSGLVLSDITSTGGVVGLWVRAKSASSYTNITITGCSGVYGFHLSNAATGVTLTNVTVTSCGTLTSDYAIRLLDVVGLTCTGLTSTNNAGWAVYVTACTGVIDISDCTITGNGLYGFRIDGAAWTSCAISDITVTGGGDSGFIANLTGNSATVSDVTVNGAGVYGFALANAVDSTFSTCIADSCGNSGFNITGDSTAGITFSDCRATENALDGFSVSGNGAGYTFNRCVANGNGVNDSTTAGDGFTAHNDAADIVYNLCLSYDNYNTAFALIGTSAGEINRCLGWNNGGDYTGAGGVDQTRGGLYVETTAVNTQTSESWTVRSCIFGQNYPCEVGLVATSAPIVDYDYNQYYATDSDNFARLTSGGALVSWATYNASYESHSRYGDPLFLGEGSNNFHITALSPCVGTGVGTDGITYDFDGVAVGTPYDCGPYEYVASLTGTNATSRQIARFSAIGMFR